MMRKMIALLAASCSLLIMSASVQAEVSYGDIYADAVADAMARHNEMVNSGDLTEGFYSAISYTLSDITGDGLDELIVQQVIGKHWAEYWIYGTDGYGCYHMGDFGCDSAGSRGDLYGFVEGILYEEAYKGSLSLGFAEWTGDGFSVTKLHEGSYGRDADPPTIPDLSAYYDSSRLLNEITGFEELHDGTYVQKKSSSSSGDKFDLDNYAYRSVTTTDSKGALVFQSEPNGSFMFDYEFWDGDDIYVNLDWRQDGYAIAYRDGVYGYVDAGYIDWDSEF